MDFAVGKYGEASARLASINLVEALDLMAQRGVHQPAGWQVRQNTFFARPSAGRTSTDLLH